MYMFDFKQGNVWKGWFEYNMLKRILFLGTCLLSLTWKELCTYISAAFIIDHHRLTIKKGTLHLVHIEQYSLLAWVIKKNYKINI